MLAFIQSKVYEPKTTTRELSTLRFLFHVSFLKSFAKQKKQQLENRGLFPDYASCSFHINFDNWVPFCMYFCSLNQKFHQKKRKSLIPFQMYFLFIQFRVPSVCFYNSIKKCITLKTKTRELSTPSVFFFYWKFSDTKEYRSGLLFLSFNSRVKVPFGFFFKGFSKERNDGMWDCFLVSRIKSFTSKTNHNWKVQQNATESQLFSILL